MKKISPDLLSEEDRVKLQILLEQLPDSAVIDASRAALILGVSERTLARLRSTTDEDGGGGPAYIKQPDGRDKGRCPANRKVIYQVGDLRAWRVKNRVGSTLDDVARRSSFVALVSDYTYTIPFWRVGIGGPIIGPVFDLIRPAVFREMMLTQNANIKVVRLQWNVALIDPWDDEGFRNLFVTKFQRILHDAASSIR